MSNSFYYFFSAVPQVLAGILALFGVFVIFKIQTLKTQLIGIGQSIVDEGNRLNIITHPLKLSEKSDTNLILDKIKKAIHRNDNNELKSAIELIDDKENHYYKKFNEVYDSLKSLVKNTIYWSIFTAVIIVICLTTIPFGDLILKNVYILYSLFTIVLVCITLSFYGLISILKKALIDNVFPNRNNK